MDLIKKEKTDHIIIRTIFLLGPALVGIIGSYVTYLLGGLSDTKTDGEFWVSGLILFIGFSIFTFFFMGIIIQTCGIKASTIPGEYVIIEHVECEDKYFTVHRLMMWGSLLWELKPLNESDYNSHASKFPTQHDATKFIESKIRDMERLTKAEECKKNKTKKIIHTI